jgi:hypothetical protein
MRVTNERLRGRKVPKESSSTLRLSKICTTPHWQAALCGLSQAIFGPDSLEMPSVEARKSPPDLPFPKSACGLGRLAYKML